MLPWSPHDRAMGVLFIKVSVVGMIQRRITKYLAILKGTAEPSVAIRFKPILELPIAITGLVAEVVEGESGERHEPRLGGNGYIRRSRA